MGEDKLTAMMALPTPGSPPRKKEELRKLRRDNRQPKLEREIIAKAAAWFAREAGSLPRSTRW